VYNERFILTCEGEDARDAQGRVLAAIEECNFDASCCFAVRLALEEALSNAFKHGNKNDPEKVVTLRCRIDGESIEIDIEDQGDGFDPEAVPDPTEEENLEIPAGRGIVLMRSFMTDVRFEPPGNRVRMTFSRTAAADAGE
jgi:serine/threonine-protein kinase RsbW